MYLTKNLEKLSDVELYQQLKIYGFPDIPVTETTRKLLTNKLNKHLQLKQKCKPINENNKYSPKTSKPRGPLVVNELIHHMEPNILSSTALSSSRDHYAKGHAVYDKIRPHYNDTNQLGAVHKLFNFPDTALSRKFLHSRRDANTSFPKFSASSNVSTHLNKVRNSWNSIYHLGLKPIFIPRILLSALFLFFTVLACFYIFNTPNFADNFNEKNINFNLCVDSSDIMNLDKCIQSHKLVQAVNLNKRLIELLQNRFKQHYCDGDMVSHSLSSMEFFEYITKTLDVDDKNMFGYLLSINHLIRNNPQWNIQIKDMVVKRVDSDKGAQKFIASCVYLFQRPKLPVLCTIYKKLQNFFIIIGIAGVLLFITYSAYFMNGYIKKSRADRLKLIDKFSKDIINELISHAALQSTGEGIVVNHLRDKLISKQNLPSMLWAWNVALNHLENHDSRIQFSLCTYNGEEVQTIKWIGNHECDYKLPYAKQWQSPAFDNKNQPVKPPTSCLKIRHMFDADEVSDANLDEIIKKAILDKIEGKCKILDIRLDKQSCVVYLRCATAEDAGIVHSEINGWWFDKRLISIKFLRLERYLNRFPNTAISSTFTQN